MERNELTELHYITHIENVPSIMANGIVSHYRASKLGHISVADEIVQERRARVIVPGGKKLHEYVNLYIYARNPMMYKLKDRHSDLCILKISPKVLDLANVVITDMNASSDYVQFKSSPEGLAEVDFSLVYAKYWTDTDRGEQFRKESIKCAEVMVPDTIKPEYIQGIYVSSVETSDRLKGIALKVPVTVNGYLFFR
jgi:hypothetical protein